MDPKGQALLKLLFNPGEEICVSNSQFACHSLPLEDLIQDKNVTLISNIATNSPVVCGTSDLILCSINPIKGPRLDENCTAFRSFLIELDVGSIKDQLATIKHIKMPFSAQVFSGSKSVHTVITLSKDLNDEKKWRHINQWILNIVTLADQNCKNPSRCIRIPGAYREPGKKQRLINIGNRVSHEELSNWLDKYDHLKPRVRERKPIPEGEADFDRLSPWVRSMLKNGIRFDNGRNSRWFSLAVDFKLAGYSQESTIDILEKFFIEDYDFKRKEWESTILSAFKYEK